MVIRGSENKLRIVAYMGREGLGQLYNDWSQLITGVNNLCFSHFPQWYDAYLNRTTEDKDGIIFCALYREKVLVAVFPLVSEKEKPFGLVTISIPCQKLLWMPDFVIAENEDHNYLFQFLCKNIAKETGIRWDLFKVYHTLETSHASQCLAGNAGVSTYTRRSATCNTLRLRPYEQMLGSYSKNFKNRLRKARNKLGKLENVEFQKVRKSEDLAWAFNEFMMLEASGWKGAKEQIKGREKGSAIASHETKRKFYERIVKIFGDDGLVEINLLRVGEKTIASQFALVIVDTCFLLKIAYDENYSTLSPGNMLLEHLLKSYEDNPLIKYVCLITDYRWHTDWRPEQLSYLTYIHFNKTPKGLLACTLLNVNEVTKGLLRKVKKFAQISTAKGQAVIAKDLARFL